MILRIEVAPETLLRRSRPARNTRFGLALTGGSGQPHHSPRMFSVCGCEAPLQRDKTRRVSIFLTPSSVFDPRISCGTGPSCVEPQDAGLTDVKVGMRARSATACWKEQIAADISCYRAGVQQHHGASRWCTRSRA
jgi:hypothetical protein